MLEFWNQGWVGIVAGLVGGVIISYAFYVAARKEPLMCESIASARVLGLPGATDYGEHVAVTYRGEVIPQLSVATITIWNAGSATLGGDALVERDPLQVVVRGAGRMLDASIELDPKAACGCAIDLDVSRPDAVRLRFDYLDPGDGFVVRVLHTANEPRVKIVGALRGVNRVGPAGPSDGNNRLLRTTRSLSPFLVTGGAIYLWSKAVPFLPQRPLWLPEQLGGLILIVTGFAIFFGVERWASREAHEVPLALRRHA